MRLDKDAERELLDAIKRFFAEELEEDIGDLKAALVLEFCLAEIGPRIYNQAIADAQAFVQDKVADLGGVLFEPEGDHGERRRSEGGADD